MAYVPKEIIDEMNQGRNWEDTECVKEYKKDGFLFKEMKCGCVYGNKLKSFGFSNHFCSEHAPRQPVRCLTESTGDEE